MDGERIMRMTQAYHHLVAVVYVHCVVVMQRARIMMPQVSSLALHELTGHA